MYIAKDTVLNVSKRYVPFATYPVVVFLLIFLFVLTFYLWASILSCIGYLFRPSPTPSKPLIVSVPVSVPVAAPQPVRPNQVIHNTHNYNTTNHNNFFVGDLEMNDVNEEDSPMPDETVHYSYPEPNAPPPSYKRTW
ncbi:hypothetical protein DFJ63DRAFT_328623 [Scheffersomyces coipomensis]|uniref:uncharacterized protein n=1 Tax=Scheffersomyces coipomensis TaxID=1788519 RepID=UPI00315CE0F9